MKIKNVIVVVLTLVALLVSVVPVSAKADSSHLVVMAPAKAAWSDKITVDVQVQNLVPRQKFAYTLVIPAGIASAVEATDGRVLKSKSGEWNIWWSNTRLMRGSTFARNTLTITLMNKSGEVYTPLLIIKQGVKVVNKTFIQLQNPEPRPSELEWMFDIPTQVSPGSSFVGSISVRNRTGSSVDININTHFAMYCANSFELVSYPSQAQAGYYFDGTIHQYSWRYAIADGQVLTWVFEETATGTTCGNENDRMIEVMNNNTSSPIYYQAILVR